MSNGRIPETLGEFDGYLTSNDIRLRDIPAGGTITRGENLGMTSAELTTLREFRIKWRSGDVVNPGAYELHLNAEKKNRATRAKVVKLQAEFGDFFRPILIRMSGSPNITSDDRIALNIAEPVTSHTHPSTPIEQRCFASVSMLGGGMVKFKCHPTTDAARASKPNGADGLIMAYRVDSLIITTDSSTDETESTVKRPDFSGPEDKTTKITQTKATFRMDFGADRAGYVLQFYTRWINSKHSELNGPWTGPFSEIIS